MNEQRLTPAKQRTRRQEALERLHIAWIAALISGALATALFFWIGLDTGDWLTVLPYLGTVALTVALARVVVQRHSQTAAGVLLVGALTGPVIRWMQTGRVTSLVWSIIFIVIYFRAFQATIDLAELAAAEHSDQAV